MKKIQTRAAIVALIIILAALALGGWASSGSGQATPSPSSQPSASPDASAPDASASPSESPSGVASPSASAGTYVLTVTVSGADNAIVRSTPVGIDCPRVCSARFPAGTVVTLTPMASAPTGGYSTQFNGFSGACTGTACTVTLNQSATVAATFALVPEFATLTVVKPGPDAGGLFISSAVPPDATTGIYCGPTCSASFQIGTTVTLYPVVAGDGGTTFVGWSGGCTGDGLCVITITGPVTVTATYTSP